MSAQKPSDPAEEPTDDPTATPAAEPTAEFEAQRPRLLAIATRLLGGTAEAEDAVQETWLRLMRTDAAAIESLQAWLTTVISRVCLDLLRSPRRVREHSWQVEPWHEEPVDPTPDPVEALVESDRISLALLLVLETLSPAERTAFILHDVFARPFEEVAEVLERSPQATRQLASRARRRLRSEDGPAHAGLRSGRGLVTAWRAAVEDGDLSALLRMLDAEVVLRADYGPRSEVIRGASDIAAQAVMLARIAADSVPVLVDGLPGLAAVHAGRVVSVMAFVIRRGVIVSLEVLADPDRLPTPESLGIEE